MRRLARGSRGIWTAVATVTVAALTAMPVHAAHYTLLNVSYDATREFFEDYNRAFAGHWQATTGDTVKLNQSHGGSGKQARSIIEGLRADVATLALAYDIDELAKQRQLIPTNWQERLPYHSAPYTSTIVLLVRKGNPKRIADWGDLARPGIAVITPNPKTSGGARWNYLAAWAWAVRQPGGSDKAAEAFLRKVFANVPVLASGARGATLAFVERGIGDVLVAWESEALLARQKLGADKFDIVVPSISILAEPPVTIIDRVVDKRGTRAVAEGYLRYLYSRQGQEIAAQHFYRPRDREVAARYAAQFPAVTLVTIDGMFGGWARAQATHFAEGGSFDRIYGL